MINELLPVASDGLALILSRIQFGLSVGYHFLFPATTLGLTFLIVLAEGAFLKTKQEVYQKISHFGVKLLAMVFSLGVATGIILPFAFGTNWSKFVEFAGSVFGIHLTLEALIAFMLEGFFLGVLLFGRKKVSPTVYFVAALMVFLGSHFSGFLILSANSWMQMPFHSLETLAAGIPQGAIDGFHLEQTLAGVSTVVNSPGDFVPGATIRVVLDDVLKVLTTPTTAARMIHTTLSSWVTGAVVFLVVAAWMLRRSANPPVAQKMFRMAAVLGHEHLMLMVKWQPVKNAAMEGIFKTQEGAPLYALGWVDEEKRETYALGMPFMLSFLETLNFQGEVVGLDNLLEQGKESKLQNRDPHLQYAPPIQPVFQTFHIMVIMGILLIVGFAGAFFIQWKKLWSQPRWVWTLFFFLLPMPYIAVEMGWMTAEIGRQPWIVYGLMKTESGLSAIPGEYVIFSLSLFVLVYTLLTFIAVKYLPKIVKESLLGESQPQGGPVQ